jgi:hypothetical protein
MITHVNVEVAMNRLTLLILLLCISATCGFAQEDYEKWKKQHEAEYQQFLSEQDKAFLDFLKKEWKDYNSSHGIVADEKPKPPAPPTIAEKKATPKPLPPAPIVKETETPKPVVKPPEPVKLPPTPENVATFAVNYFGESLKLPQPSINLPKLPATVDGKSIGEWYEGIATTKYQPLLDAFKAVRTQANLNDWGYFLLLGKTAETLYPTLKNEKTLFVWFMLLKSEITCKIGYHQGAIALLLPCENMIYSIRYFTLDGKKFFALQPNGLASDIGALSIYDGNYPGATTIVSLRLLKTVTLENTAGKRDLKFKYGAKEYAFSLEYDKTMINYCRDYPQSDLDVFMSAPASPIAYNSFIKVLKPLVVGKTETEAANFLLRFVQTAFEYKTDDEQFHREKFDFAEEVLFYPACDCDDRTVLYSYLVSTLLGLPVVGVDYPGHVATAVKFSANVEGDNVMVDGSKYVICDPTYINADIGMAMPQFKTTKPGIIKFTMAK